MPVMSAKLAETTLQVRSGSQDCTFAYYFSRPISRLEALSMARPTLSTKSITV